MVVKYAMGEREVILQRKAKEEAEKKWRSVAKERDDLAAKVKVATGEKAKVQQLADSRVNQVKTSLVANSRDLAAPGRGRAEEGR